MNSTRNEENSYFEGMDVELGKPRVNIITKEEFQERAEQVFRILWEKLSMSFGPYGAPTMIYQYPFKHVTKDGFTIMKNISFDASKSNLDQTICDLAEDVCARLNYSVGDGTTTAVISTYSTYQNYLKILDDLNSKNFMPRDIISTFKVIKDEIIAELQSKVRQIRSSDPDELANNIHDVVYISSNGDVEISQMISDLYRNLGGPSITCQKSDNERTYAEIISGYKLPLILNDKLYINSDNNELIIPDADIIILGTRVTTPIYQKLLVPLNEACRQRGRRLIVAANAYDEVAIRQVIRRDLNNEYNKNHSINMVLCTYRAVSEHQRTMIEDFATLCGTQVLTKNMVNDIIDLVWSGETQLKDICEVMPLDNRDIPNINIVKFDKYSKGMVFAAGNTDYGEYTDFMETIENPYPVGYVRGCTLGLKSSRFKEFFCEEEKLDALRKDAIDNLTEKENKYKNLGTFTLEVTEAMERYNSLKLVTGIIYVGGDSELSRGMNRDTIDDAVKAAASAYEYGVVLGCNVALIQACHTVSERYYDKYFNAIHKTEQQRNVTWLSAVLAGMLANSFKDVYKTVLGNAMYDIEFKDDYIPSFPLGDDDSSDVRLEYCKKMADFKGNDEIILTGRAEGDNSPITLFDHIINLSVNNNAVYDVSKKRFSNAVVNSLKTDEEVLVATIELISMLITGNQVIVTQRNNY